MKSMNRLDLFPRHRGRICGWRYFQGILPRHTLGWRVFFDGVTNDKVKGSRVVLVLESFQHYPMATKLWFNWINNMVEYEVYILGLKMTIDMNVHELLVIGDWDLLIHQVQWEWVGKNPKITLYVQYLQKLFRRFCMIESRDTTRKHIKLVDALATLNQWSNIKIQVILILWI